VYVKTNDIVVEMSDVVKRRCVVEMSDIAIT
jgi:hypothetical protein